ncbi:MAG TPA: nucleoside-diphosphate sugar epimerase/dehydratase [Candidatus Acidoferrales bacterium]|nr:nucleoside-diphosphate sugar epimerase/dehydratase [Candidatus Acidoferrales bacterium]
MESLKAGQATREESDWNWKLPPDAAAFGRNWARAHAAPLILTAEVALAAASYALAVFLLGGAIGSSRASLILAWTIGPLILFRLGALVSVKLYRRSLRHASLLDILSIAKAVTASSILFWGFASLEFVSLKIPFAVFLIDWAFLLILWCGLHFSARILRVHSAASQRAGRRVVIVGAGDAGMTLMKELTLDPSSPCLPVAIVDDDESKHGRNVYGICIAGGSADLAKISADSNAEEILICIPSATRAQMRSLLNVCRQTNLPIRTLPSLADLVDGKVSKRDLRTPQIEDLLRRDAMRVDPEETRRVVGGKVVLVTGAGGSIGSELCRQIARAEPEKLLLLDRSENSLFYINMEVTEHLEPGRVVPLLADLLNRDRIREILRAERPDIIFHAAAHKHVGMLELHPQEAIRNNVLGTRNIAEAALECGTRRFINISTDKAVSPRNFMGLSKKVTELCIREIARIGRVRYSNVRFGNVAGSTGSVLRIFKEQIEKGGPVRVTDPRATRYFMSVPEAVHLILQAAALGKGGETFVFDMGEPLNIYDLAKTMMLFAGLKPHEDVPIEFTGLKEGEKVEERLWEDWENPAVTARERIFMVRQDDELSRGILAKIERMEELLHAGKGDALLDCLREFAPAFRRKQCEVGMFPVPDTPAAISNSWGPA